MDDSDEPEAICSNCDGWAGGSAGRGVCMNKRSINCGVFTHTQQGCGVFFPDSRRWPDADHGEASEVRDDR